MLKRAAFVLMLGFAATAAAAQPRQAQASGGPPRLIVAIAVDQLSADLFAQYRQHFTGGFRRLTGGAVFPSGYQAHAATETCPGHSTILTGSRPSRTGIVANNWFDLGISRDDKRVYCAEDPRVTGSSSRSGRYTVSPHHLRVPTLGDLMKQADARSRVVAVAGKDRAAMMMGGRSVDQRWWWSESEFSSQRQHRPTPAVAEANQAIGEAIGRAVAPMPLPAVCAARSRAVPLEGGAGAGVGAGRFARAAGDRTGFRISPALDGATLALAMALRNEMRLGEGQATDLLIVGLSATDYVGHAYGTQGAEMCINLIELDRSLGDFFERLDATGIDYLVVLTADHGGLDVPERIRADGGVEARRVLQELDVDAVSTAVATALGLSGRVLRGEGAAGDMYVERSLPPAMRARVIEEAVRRYRASPHVAAVFTAAELRAAPAPAGTPEEWSLIDRARASFDPQRSGDFVVLLHSRVMPIARPSGTYVATHGSPWDYDRRVPILFWRRGMRAFEQPLGVETVDILPTLAPLVGLDIPAGTIDGRCLDLIEGPETSCPPR